MDQYNIVENENKEEYNTLPYPHPEEESLRQVIINTKRTIKDTKQHIEALKKHHLRLIELCESCVYIEDRAEISKYISESQGIIDHLSKFLSTMEKLLKDMEIGYIEAASDTIQRRKARLEEISAKKENVAISQR